MIHKRWLVVDRSPTTHLIRWYITQECNMKNNCFYFDFIFPETSLIVNQSLYQNGKFNKLILSLKLEEVIP
jgi:hypothetical protein